MENIYRTTCRLCGSSNLKDLISIGEQYINDFPSSLEQKGRNGKCPLDVMICRDCTLFQLRHTAPQELLYSRHYWYKSGINDTIKGDLNDVVETSKRVVNFRKDDVFLDIGANDGTMLKILKGQAIRVGCEPAANLHDELKTNCEYMIDDFWSKENYERLKIGKAKVITAIGMFYDMEDPNQFIRDAAKVLADDGVFIAQLMTLKPMLEHNDVGNICHEHLEFYTYQSLKYLFEKNGLEIYKVAENGINGGSYRLFARHFKTGSVDYPECYTEDELFKFEERLKQERTKCVDYIREANRLGKKVYAYGASTKGNVILQYYGLDRTLIQGVADRNPQKWGKYTLTDIPIVSEEEGRRYADLFLILPYGFINEFVRREKRWLEDGGEFVAPLPEFRVIREGDMRASK
ncbi:MAG: methyltransferase domain-containing protein [Deltaproteobacteria bacterium]|nr:methyltransferase domain-containing protein [Deltaproteobacteria bacterium]